MKKWIYSRSVVKLVHINNELPLITDVVFQDLIVAKLRLAELESELTTVRGQKMVKQENPAVLSDFIPSIFKIIS